MVTYLLYVNLALPKVFVVSLGFFLRKCKLESNDFFLRLVMAVFCGVLAMFDPQPSSYSLFNDLRFA